MREKQNHFPAKNSFALDAPQHQTPHLNKKMGFGISEAPANKKCILTHTQTPKHTHRARERGGRKKRSYFETWQRSEKPKEEKENIKIGISPRNFHFIKRKTQYMYSEGEVGN